MISFNDGWAPPDSMEGHLAKKIMEALLNQQANPAQSLSPDTAKSLSALHIGEYLDEMFYEKGYSLMNITITKDPDLGNLQFDIIHKEK